MDSGNHFIIGNGIPSSLLTIGLAIASITGVASGQTNPPQPSSVSADTTQEVDIRENSSTLPIPEHPNRKPETPDSTKPKESQPKRESRPTLYTQARRNNSMPIPGRPGRNLPPLGEPEEEESSEPEEEAIEAETPERLGLFQNFPHQFRDGGLTFETIYTGETFTKAKGGRTIGHPTNYRSNLDVVAIVDTAKMGWWENGRLFVYGQNLSGRPLSPAEVGDFQLFSNLDSTISETDRPDFTTIAEYWYEHVAFDQILRTKIGKQDANVDFALTDLGGDFVHSSFGLPPMIPLPTFPSQALGMATFISLTERLSFGFGAYDGTLPSGPQGQQWGFETLGRNGAITLYQLEWKGQFGSRGQLPSTVRTGMWHHSDDEVWTELTPDPNPRTFSQNYGTFTTFDQMIWKESDAGDDDQGFGVFGQFGWAPGNRNAIQEYYGGGLVYKGLLPSRDADLFGLAFANALFSGYFRNQSAADGDIMNSYETAIECFYKWQASPFISFQPDLQYIASPSGLYRDALLPGMRFEVVF